jgi:hypothetical protein
VGEGNFRQKHVVPKKREIIEIKKQVSMLSGCLTPIDYGERKKRFRSQADSQIPFVQCPVHKSLHKEKNEQNRESAAG